jgi:hypothetical protein
MKHITALIVTAASLLFSSQSFAFDTPPMERGAQICFGYAMVGYDSVINSRLGVPAEYALGLAVKSPITPTADASYSTQVLKVVLEAYMWPGNPHDYAVGVFYNCAKDQGKHFDISAD